MSFAIFKQKLDDIGADLGFRTAIAEDAGTFLRNAITARCDGRIPELFTYWTMAEDADFVAAAAELEKTYNVRTAERAQGTAKYQGRNVVHRVTGVWLEGKVYRACLTRCWSYESRGELQWAAEVAPFARLILGFSRYPSKTDRARLEKDLPSEYLAERAMKDLFETHFRVVLEP